MVGCSMHVAKPLGSHGRYTAQYSLPLSMYFFLKVFHYVRVLSDARQYIGIL